MHFAVIILIGVIIWRLLRGGGVSNASMSLFVRRAARRCAIAAIVVLVGIGVAILGYGLLELNKPTTQPDIGLVPDAPNTESR